MKIMKKYILFILILSVLFYSSSKTYEQQSIIPKLMIWLPGEPFKGVCNVITHAPTNLPQNITSSSLFKFSDSVSELKKYLLRDLLTLFLNSMDIFQKNIV